MPMQSPFCHFHVMSRDFRAESCPLPVYTVWHALQLLLARLARLRTSVPSSEVGAAVPDLSDTALPDLSDTAFAAVSWLCKACSLLAPSRLRMWRNMPVSGVYIFIANKSIWYSPPPWSLVDPSPFFTPRNSAAAPGLLRSMPVGWKASSVGQGSASLLCRERVRRLLTITHIIHIIRRLLCSSLRGSGFSLFLHALYRKGVFVLLATCHPPIRIG